MSNKQMYRCTLYSSVRLAASCALMFLMIVPFQAHAGAKSPSAAIEAIAHAIEEKPEDFFNYVDIVTMGLTSPTFQSISKDQAEQITKTLEDFATRQQDPAFALQLADMFASLGELQSKQPKSPFAGMTKAGILTELLETGALANNARKRKDVEWPWVPEWLVAAKIEKPERDVGIATVSLPDGQQAILGLTPGGDDLWRVVALAQNKALAIKGVQQAKKLYAASAVHKKNVTKQKQAQAKAAKVLGDYPKRLAAAIKATQATKPTKADLENFHSVLHPNLFVSTRPKTLSLPASLTKASAKDVLASDAFWKSVTIRIADITSKEATSKTLSASKNSLEILARVLKDALPVIAYNKGDLLVLTAQTTAKMDMPAGTVYMAFKEGDKGWQCIVFALAANDDPTLFTNFARIRVDGLPAMTLDLLKEFANRLPSVLEEVAKLEAERKASFEKERLVIVKELQSFAETLAQALEKNDRKAFLAHLDVLALAVSPQGAADAKGFAFIGKQPALGATLRRAVLSDDTKAEGQTSLILSVSPKALRKASSAPEGASTKHGTLALPASGNAPAMVLGVHKQGDTWQVISATPKNIDVSALSTALARAPKSPDSPDATMFRAMAEALAAKDGTKVVSFLNIPFMEYYRGNKDYDKLAYWLTYPSELAKRQAALVATIQKTGHLPWGKFSISAADLETGLLQYEKGFRRLALPAKSVSLMVHPKHPGIMALAAYESWHDYQTWPMDDKYLAKNITSYTHKVVDKALRERLLAHVQFSELRYRVVQIEGNLRLHVESMVQNTLKSPVQLERVAFSIVDKNGKYLASWTDYERKDLPPPPNATQLSWNFSLSQENTRLLQYIAQHGGELRLAVASMNFNKKNWNNSRSNDSLQIEKTADGLWQSPTLPFIKPFALTSPSNLALNDAEKKAMQALIKKNLNQEWVKADALAKQLFDSVSCRASVSKQANRGFNFIIQSTWKYPLSTSSVEVHLMDMSNPQMPVIVQTWKENFREKISPSKSLHYTSTLYDNSTKDLNKDSILQCSITALGWNGMRITEDGGGLMIDGATSPWVRGTDTVLSYPKKVLPPAMKKVFHVPVGKPEPTPTKQTPPTETKPTDQAPVEAPAKQTAPVDKAETAPAPSDKPAPIAGAGKKPGKAILVAAASAHDYVGPKSFSPDKNPDSRLQVAFAPSGADIIGIRVDTLGKGTRGRWQNNTSTGGMPLLVFHNGAALNRQGGDLKIKAETAGLLNLFLHDTGSIAAGKNKLRVALIFSDGKRSYAVFDPAAQ